MSLNSIKWFILHRNIKAPYLWSDPKSHEVFKLIYICTVESAGFVSFTEVFFPQSEDRRLLN